MKNIRSSIAAKSAAYLILGTASLMTLLSFFGILTAVECEFYTLNTEQFKEYLADYPSDFQALHIFIYDYRYLLIGLCAAGILIGIISFLFLLVSAGHQKGQEGIQKNWLTAIPLDVFTGIIFLVLALIIAAGDSFSNWEVFVYILFAFPLSVVILTAFLADCAIRIKLGKWWQNSLLFYSWTVFLKLGKGTFRLAGKMISYLPLLWKTILGIILLFLLEMFFLLLIGSMDGLLLIWLGEKFLFSVLVLYLALVLHKLQDSGRELAKGNLAHQTDTSKMYWDFKEHGENLNSIALGMSRAVEERLKSERMKTELITNVSHDLKTPLTSIINYSDLIASEQNGDLSQLKEYASALHRQSQRMKKLLEDLVEASKVSSGNVEVLLAPCETDVLLTQAVGEYEEKLKEQDLELIIKQPEQPLKILVDGRHIWRVFDNLMNNVYKYAQGGTRVYLTLEKKEKKAVFSLKNTSRQSLDISSDELMERFVRGDRSRHTEGSGLGLSIARSLTNLQKGEFDLTIDGDLFKVVLTFDLAQ